MPEKVIIIGSGPAAWTSAIYAARANLNPLVFAGRPKQVPSGLDYFSFGNFERRLHAALSKVVPL